MALGEVLWWVNQSLPSGPAQIAPGSLFVGISNSVIVMSGPLIGIAGGPTTGIPPVPVVAPPVPPVVPPVPVVAPPVPPVVALELAPAAPPAPLPTELVLPLLVLPLLVEEPVVELPVGVPLPLASPAEPVPLALLLAAPPAPVTAVDVPFAVSAGEQPADPTKRTSAETTLRVTREAPGSWR
jgi:hypothetical protein